MKTLLFTDDLFLEHDPGEGHPECIDRLRAIRGELEKLPTGAQWETPRDALDQEILRVHTAEHLADLSGRSGRSTMLDPDTYMSPRSFDAAKRAAGATVSMVERLMRREGDNGFALVRPPGHHAERDRAMGFCLFNNVAIAAEHARALGAERVAILDWDVHHGNGSQHHFESRDDVLFLSTHRYPFYPGTGAAEEVGSGKGQGFTVNVPLPPSMGDGDYGAIFRDLLAPVISRFSPNLILVSAGFDSYARDPLGGMAVSEEGFGGMCSLIRDLAVEAGAPLGLVLEGGYDFGGLARSVRRCVEVLCGERVALRTDASNAGAKALTQAQRIHRA